MKIKNRKDGTFDFRTAKGRKISGLYARYPHETKPSALTLYTIVENPAGKSTGIVSNYEDLDGRLDNSELREMGKALERRAEAVERGESTPDNVEQLDIKNTPTWPRFLKNNPDFLKQHPHYLEDALRGDDPTT